MRIKRPPIVTVTAIPRGFEAPPADIDSWDAISLRERFRQQLERTRRKLEKEEGPLPWTGADWAIFGLHCEYDPTANLATFHEHGLAAGSWIMVLESMRQGRLYRHQKGDRVRDRIRMSRKPIHNLPAPLGYPWQLFWPSRARGDGSDDGVGFNQLHRNKRRLPEPYHTQMLLWLDRQRIEDMTLLMGLRVGPEGFVKTYVKGRVRNELCLPNTLQLTCRPVQ